VISYEFGVVFLTQVTFCQGAALHSITVLTVFIYEYLWSCFYLIICYHCYFLLTGVKMYKRRDWCPGYKGYSSPDSGSGTVAMTVLQDHLWL